MISLKLVKPHESAEPLKDALNSYSLVSDYVSKKIEDMDIVLVPYPHFTVLDIFPQTLYQQILEHKISSDCLKTLTELKRVGGGYPDSRKVIPLTTKMFILSDSNRQFWEPFANWLLHDFKKILLEKFKPYLLKRFGHVPQLAADALYTRDTNGYQLSPHTDSLKKVITLLIYLPKNSLNPQCGTVMYVPKDPKFTCPGGPHHNYEKFNKWYSAPYVPNSMFGFLKTNNSFHGVEPITIERDLLIYDLQLCNT